MTVSNVASVPKGIVAYRRQVRQEVREAARLADREDIRFLVKSYYQIQDFRKAAANMVLAQEVAEKPSYLHQKLAHDQRMIEDDLKVALDAYAQNDPTGRWMLSIHGIGPVIAAGFLAHVDINRAATAGDIWSFAGLNPGVKWEKGQRRPWNADLKVLCWKIGESFCKTHNSEKSFYGPIYAQRKALEVARNEAGEFAEQAARTLLERKIQDKATLECYESGKLPAGRIELRARRVAVKLWISHAHDVMMWYQLGRRAPVPYAIQHMGHAHQIICPNAPWDGWEFDVKGASIGVSD